MSARALTHATSFVQTAGTKLFPNLTKNGTMMRHDVVGKAEKYTVKQFSTRVISGIGFDQHDVSPLSPIAQRFRPWRKCVRRTRMAALDLKPRRQIRQPLRGGVNEHGLHALVETSEDESTDKNEKYAKYCLDGMGYR